MSIIRNALKQATWLAAFRVLGQVLSWAATIVVARLLIPDDYGLMELATILTGYVALFSELGLGAAIVQRDDVSQEELSSLHWLMVMWSMVMAAACLLLAGPTVWLFEDERTYYITQLCALIYPFASLVIVPRNMLNREMRFKAVGAIEAGATVIACISMVAMAYSGAGVWTLVFGSIIRAAARAMLMFYVVPWRPSKHFRLAETLPFLGFGINLAVANSLDYISNKSDRFFGGRAMGAASLGHYALGLQLASMPNEKIVSLINSVAFPVLSRFQSQPKEARLFYLSLLQGVAFVTGPLFFGLAAVAEDAVLVLVGWQWYDTIVPLRLLCIGQYFVALSTSSSVANVAQGRPHWTLRFNLLNVAVVPVSFWCAAQWGIAGLAVPWVTIIPASRIGYILITARQMNISARRLGQTLLQPSIATSLMLICVLCSQSLLAGVFESRLAILIAEIVVGGSVYAGYLFAIRKELKEIGSRLLAIKVEGQEAQA